jgi:putative transcriptional regulator
MKIDFDLFNIHNSLKPKLGRVLVSEPLSRDGFFGRSVVLLTEHNQKGSMGFILNKPTKMFIGHFFDSFKTYKIPVFVGGPVATDTLHFIHSSENIISNAQKIGKDLYWDGNIHEIPDLIEKGELLPSEIKFFIGYSGWDSGQLEKEIKQNFWVVSELSPKQIITDNPENLWEKAISNGGDKYKFWLNIPEDFISN